MFAAPHKPHYFTCDLFSLSPSPLFFFFFCIFTHNYLLFCFCLYIFVLNFYWFFATPESKSMKDLTLFSPLFLLLFFPVSSYGSLPLSLSLFVCLWSCNLQYTDTCLLQMGHSTIPLLILRSKHNLQRERERELDI